MKKIFIIFIELFIIILIIISVKDIVIYSKNHIKAQKIETNLKDMKKKKNNGNGENFVEEVSKKYDNTVAFIEISNTSISYPIVQAANNSYYLNHSIDKEYNINGSIFLDYRNKKDFTDDNSIIYGHNMKSGKQFHDLKKLKSQNFYNENKKLKITTNSESKEYLIYSVYMAEPNYNYREVNFDTYEKKLKFLEETKENSLIKVDNFISNKNKLITLYTCSDDGRERIVVHAIEE